jgi:hypothetical protein
LLSDLVSAGSGLRLVRFTKAPLFRWAGTLWWQELNARPVLVNPPIPNVNRDSEPMSEIAGSSGEFLWGHCASLPPLIAGRHIGMGMAI